MFYTYIIFSSKFNRYYIGSTEDVDIRLVKHNQGKVRSTKGYVPWVLVYKETFATRSEAYRREMQIKSYKHGEAFKKLIS